MVAGTLVGLSGLIFLATRGIDWSLTIVSLILSGVYLIMGAKKYPERYANWYGSTGKANNEFVTWGFLVVDGLHWLAITAIITTAILLLVGSWV